MVTPRVFGQQVDAIRQWMFWNSLNKNCLFWYWNLNDFHGKRTKHWQQSESFWVVWALGRTVCMVRMDDGIVSFRDVRRWSALTLAFLDCAFLYCLIVVTMLFIVRTFRFSCACVSFAFRSFLFFSPPFHGRCKQAPKLVNGNGFNHYEMLNFDLNARGTTPNQ